MQTAQATRTSVIATVPRPSERGLQIASLAPGDRLIIRTRAAIYDVTVLSPVTRQVLVTGGVLFPEPINARLEGCSSNGSFLRLGSVAVGSTVEFRTPKEVVVTAVVQSIGFVEHG
jgi:hypothetical protein